MRRSIVLMCFVLIDGAAAAAPQAASTAENAIYAAKYRKAKDLVGLLERQFKGAANFRALEDAATNQVLLNGSKSEVADSLRLLAQLDRKPATIAVEAFLFVAAEQKAPEDKSVDKALAPKELTGPADQIAAKIQALSEQKHIAEMQRVQLSAQENQPGNLKQLELRPLVIARAVTATGVVSQNISREYIGVTMAVTPRLTPEREVILDIKLDWSRLHTKADGIQFTDTSTFSGPVSIASGQAVLVRAVKTTAPMERGQTFVVITAKIMP